MDEDGEEDGPTRTDLTINTRHPKMKSTSRSGCSEIKLSQKRKGGHIYLHGVCAPVESFGFCEELRIVVQPPVTPILSMI